MISIESLETGLLVPIGSSTLEHVSGTRAVSLVERAHDNRFAGDCDGTAKKRRFARIRCLEVGFLGPIRSVSHEHVGGARRKGVIVLLVAINSSCAAVFLHRADHNDVSGHSHAISKEIVCRGIGSFEISLLRPVRARAHEDIGSTCAFSQRVELVPIHRRRVAVFEGRAHDDCVSGYRNRFPEPAVGGRIRGFQKRRLMGTRSRDQGDCGRYDDEDEDNARTHCKPGCDKRLIWHGRLSARFLVRRSLSCAPK
jgi:hypothetical protein